MVRSCIDRMNLVKESPTFELLKYTPEDFKNVDHIIPVSKFDKNTPLFIINSLDNLQPLWALENLSKSNKI
jgi:hypothetical protein